MRSCSWLGDQDQSVVAEILVPQETFSSFDQPEGFYVQL